MIQLLPQQIEAENKLKEWKCGALFMDPGTAKTRIAVDLINRIPDIDLIVWVGPLRSIYPLPDADYKSIIEEINKWGGFQCENVVYKGIETLQSSDRQYLQLYNQVQKAPKCFIVVDESLKMKNAEAKRTQRMLTLGNMTNYKLILNGTPITKNLLDLWPQMEFLSPKILKMGIAEFKNTFCKYTKITKFTGNYGRKYEKEFITGYENIDYLYSLIRHYIYECDLKLEISQYWNNYNYSIDSEAKYLYYTLKEKYLDNEMMQMKNNNIFLEMTQKMQHTYSCTEHKFEILEKHFKEYPQEKHIVFCKYINSRELCKKYFPKATILSYQKESMSLNLQHLPYTIFFDKIWDYALRTQGSRRNYRTGAEYDVRYWDLTGDVGLENLIDKNIKKKTSQAEYFKNITKEELKECL